MTTKRYRTPMEDSTSVSIRTAEAAKEYTRLPTRIAIWAPGKKISSQEMASMSMKKGKSTRENSSTARSMERVSTTTTAEPFFRGSGTKIESMDSASSLTPTPKNTKETGSMDKNTARESTTIKTATNILVTGSKTKRMATGSSSTLAEHSTMDSGLTTRPPTKES